MTRMYLISFNSSLRSERSSHLYLISFNSSLRFERSSQPLSLLRISNSSSSLRSSPRLNDETMIKTRIRHMFEEGARVLYRVPEVWAEWSAWESGLGDKTTGISSLSKVYEMAKVRNCEERTTTTRSEAAS